MIVAFRTSIVPPNLISRILFIIALFLPLSIYGKKIYLPCLITFVTVSLNSFAFGYLPYEIATYSIVCCGSLLLLKSELKIQPFYLFSLLYISCVNVITSGSPQNIFWSIATIALGSYLADKNSSNNRFYMLNAFSIISLILSILYLLNYEAFLDTYNSSDGIQRSGWTDPNYLSCIVGMGVISSLILLIKNNTKRFLLKLFWIVTITISIMSQILLASRGGLLCTSISVMCLIAFINIKTRYKLFLILTLCCFIVFLYNNNYFELLTYRMQNDSTDSGRMDIWNMKLSLFFQEGNIFTWLFGIGYEKAFRLSYTSQAIGFHNDFLAMFCGYGIIGFVVFVYKIFISPLSNIKNTNRSILISLIAYLLIACLTLEPLASGNLTYWAFYYLILLFCKKETSNQ